jgi:hypothetical protein
MQHVWNMMALQPGDTWPECGQISVLNHTAEQKAIHTDAVAVQGGFEFSEGPAVSMPYDSFRIKDNRMPGAQDFVESVVVAAG